METNPHLKANAYRMRYVVRYGLMGWLSAWVMLFVFSESSLCSQEALSPNPADFRTGAAAPRVMGERGDGRLVVPRLDPNASPGGSLEGQLNAPYIPPLMSFEREKMESEEPVWYDYDDQLEQFRRSQRTAIDWAGSAFGTFLYDTNRQGTLPGGNAEAEGFSSFIGGTVLMDYGSPGGRLHFDISYALALISSWGEELVDSVNQNFASSLTLNAAKTTLSLRLLAGQQPYTSLDLGANVERTNVSAEAILSHQWRPKWSLGASARTLNNFYASESAQDLSQNLMGVFADYQVRPKLSAGLQYNLGLVEFSGSSQEQISHQGLGRLSWDVGSKLELSGSFGLDRTASGDVANTSAIWEISGAYRVSAKSSLSVTAFRRTAPSVALENQFFYMTGVMFGAGTQLTDRISVGASGGIQSQNYLSTQAGMEADREDLLINLALSLGYRVGARTSLSLFYQNFSNSSTGVDSRALDGGQVGLSISVRF